VSDTWTIIVAVFAAGCVGGLTNAVITGELQLPQKDVEAKVFRPGWLGNVIVGGVAALVFWGLYGPMAAAVVIGHANPLGIPAVLHVSELFGALLTGVGGGRLLTAAVDKQIAEREKHALTQAKDNLAETLVDLASETLTKEVKP
jgi:hypothetical protein